MKILTLPILLLLSHLAMAQITVNGTVTDEEGQSIPGANVVIKGTTNGTFTDMNGKFTIDVPEGTTLLISFIGYVTKEIPITENTTLDIVLEQDIRQLEEVVVVGYGTERKSDVTGAVTSVKVDDRVKRQYTTVDQILQGRSAGVQVTGSGQPGSGISVRIRGTNSLRGNNEPLYVVDGIIISSAGEDAQLASTDGNATQVNQNGLNGINPRDIESIEILKDASATAIYGSRGANGVVLITTKKGNIGKASINAYATTSVTTITKKINVLDGVDFARYRNEAAIVDGELIPYQITGNEVYPISYSTDGPVVSTDPVTQINWQDEFFQMSNDYNGGFSISGGSESGGYYVSAGYNNQVGVIETSRFQSGDLRINLNQKLNDKLSVDARFNAFYAQGTFAQDGDRAGGANRSFINNVLLFDPVIDGDIQDYADNLGLSSPYSWINDFSDDTEELRVIGRLGLTYKLPVEGLSYEINAGGNFRSKERNRWYGLTTFQGGSANGVLSMSQLSALSYQVNNLLRYNNLLAKGHRLNAVLGFTIDGREVNNELYEVQDFATTSFTTDQPFYGQTVTQPLTVVYNPTNILSFLGRANYTLINKYVFTATARYDGVSKFRNENRWSFFPSVAVAWRAIEENFVESLNIFDDLKVRAGWGRIGNHGIGPFQTQANYGGILYATPNNGTSVAFVPFNIANEGLIWETTEQINIGLDFGVWENRIQGSIDVYQKLTKDLLQQLALPPSTGFNTLSANRGEISNKGLEVMVSGIVVDNGDLNVTVGGNFSMNRSRIESLGIPLSSFYIDGQLEQRSYYYGDNVSTGTYFKSPANIFMVGEQIGMFVGYETDGIYQSTDSDIIAGAQPGDIRIVDQNGDGVIDINDRTIIGNPNPDFIYGINLSVEYKQFTLSALVNGVFGNEIANGNMIRLSTPEGTGTNIIPAAYHGAWRPDRESNLYPRIGYNKENSASAITDRIIEDGSFLRLGNVTLNYRIPVESVKGISGANVYLAGRNLLTITGYTGFDPELNSFLYNGNILGVDWAGVPNTMSFTLGASIEF